MHLFLIRHGETEHNIAGLLAGVTDSRLTNHGALQTQKLGASLVKDRELRFTHVFSSDLQRAFMTANEICKAQNAVEDNIQKLQVVKLEVLREQDFGSLELVSWTSRRAQEDAKSQDPGPDDAEFKAKETKDAMRSRANAFLDDYVTPLFTLDGEDPARIAVVSHGIFLAHLWRVLLSRFAVKSVKVNPGTTTADSGSSIEYMSWSNTGCLEVNIRHLPTVTESVIETNADVHRGQSSSCFSNATMTIQAINDKRHLTSLKRSRGGIGSATFDQRQQNIGSFFKKVKVMSPSGKIRPVKAEVISFMADPQHSNESPDVK